jgi:hypothetical protein
LLPQNNIRIPGGDGLPLSGRSWTAALAAAWITVTGSAQALIPLAARAFDPFDVAANRPS